MASNSHKGEEPVGWVTVKGKHFPKWADGSIGWQNGEEDKGGVTRKDVEELTAKKDALKDVSLNAKQITQDEVDEYVRTNPFTTSKNKRYDTSRSKGKPKSGEDAWMNHMSPEDRRKTMAMLNDPNIEHAVVDNRMHGEKMESILGKLWMVSKNGGSIRQLPKDLKNLKKGDYFTKKDLTDPKDSQVWVRGEWIPSAKAYSCYKFNDTNQEALLKSDAWVYTDFFF